jgi:site-specific DNA-methyltransferase (adenine-specific)
MMAESEFSQQVSVAEGDCLQVMQSLKPNTVDLIYLDPPFFTNRIHKLSNRSGTANFSFNDIWADSVEYAEFLASRLQRMRELLKPSGSLFFHCDKSASHLIRALLDQTFGAENFQSEIIWYYKRWSNSRTGLLPAHQTIFFYSKTDNFKFNKTYEKYSNTTNVDQILQKRVRGATGKAAYALDANGEAILGIEKPGVPLSDVWEMPYLNPKARERTGYPTQKPLHLLERVISLVTDPGDLVLDPFCGSGTTIVAAQLLNRRALGIDVSKDAVDLANSRLREPVKSVSNLLEAGKESYNTANQDSMALLTGLDVTPIHRNAGMDAILKEFYMGRVVPIRVQKEGETLGKAAAQLLKASEKKQALKAILIQTSANEPHDSLPSLPEWLIVIKSPASSIREKLESI